MITKQSRRATEEVAEFNKETPVGSPCLFWTGEREGNGQLSRTRSIARVLGKHTAAVLVDGHVGAVALSHIEVIR